MSSSTQRPPALATQAFWLMAARTIGFALSVLLPLLLVRMFNQTDYGVYKQAFIIVATTYYVLSMSVGASAFYFLPWKVEGRSQVVLNILIYNSLVGLVPLILLSVYPGILAVIFGSSELVPFARHLGVLIFLVLFSALLEHIATALQDVVRSTVFIVFAQFSKVMMMTLGAVLGGSVEALLYAAIAQGTLQSVILLWYLHKQFGPFWSSFDWKFFSEQITYALPYGLNGMLYTAQADLNSYFVANAFGAAAFAIYSVGCTQIPLMGMIGESIGAVLLSRMSELRHQGRPREILLLAARAMRKLAFVYLPVFALLLVVGHDFLILMFTRKYEASWPIFAVNLCMLPLLILVTDPIIRAYADQPYYLLRVRTVTLALQVVILVIAVRYIGMTGAILTLLGISIIERSAVTLRIASVIGMKVSDLHLFKDIGRIAGVSLICGIVTYLVRSMLGAIHPFLALLICGAVFASVFFAFVVRLRLLEPDEKNFIQRHLRRLPLRLPLSARTASAGARCGGAD